ncbi:element of external origin (plasmid) [Cupriavidus necator H850]|nr:element of external origin [Cupriavidus necator H850]
MSQSLTLGYAKVLYLLEDIEVAEYPDGHVELWATGASLPYTTYDRFAEVDQGAIVDNKRLGRTLAIAAEVQALRDNRRFAAPPRTLHGEPPRPAKVPLNIKRKRLVNRLDLEQAMRHHPLLASNDDSAECPPILPTPEMTPCDPLPSFAPVRLRRQLLKYSGHSTLRYSRQIIDMDMRHVCSRDDCTGRRTFHISMRD